MRPEECETATELMIGLAERTGLTSQAPTRRYLWTDAFAVCNFLELGRLTGDERYGSLALQLVDQVHQVSRSTGQARYHTWAPELAEVSHESFTHEGRLDVFAWQTSCSRGEVQDAAFFLTGGDVRRADNDEAVVVDCGNLQSLAHTGEGGLVGACQTIDELVLDPLMRAHYLYVAREGAGLKALP